MRIASSLLLSLLVRPLWLLSDMDMRAEEGGEKEETDSVRVKGEECSEVVVVAVVVEVTVVVAVTVAVVVVVAVVGCVGGGGGFVHSSVTSGVYTAASLATYIVRHAGLCLRTRCLSKFSRNKQKKSKKSEISKKQ